MTMSVIAEVESSGLFEDDNVNWQYCRAHATFSHREACEFIIHCGEPSYWKERIKQMKEYGCTKDFIEEYEKAAEAGAVRVLFYA
jgi:hypothetical protein